MNKFIKKLMDDAHSYTLPEPRDLTVGERARYWRERSKHWEGRCAILERRVKRLKEKK